MMNYTCVCTVTTVKAYSTYIPVAGFESVRLLHEYAQVLQVQYV